MQRAELRHATRAPNASSARGVRVGAGARRSRRPRDAGREPAGASSGGTGEERSASSGRPWETAGSSEARVGADVDGRQRCSCGCTEAAVRASTAADPPSSVTGSGGSFLPGATLRDHGQAWPAVNEIMDVAALGPGAGLELGHGPPRRPRHLAAHRAAARRRRPRASGRRSRPSRWPCAGCRRAGAGWRRGPRTRVARAVRLWWRRLGHGSGKKIRIPASEASGTCADSSATASPRSTTRLVSPVGDPHQQLPRSPARRPRRRGGRRRARPPPARPSTRPCPSRSPASAGRPGRTRRQVVAAGLR